MLRASKPSLYAIVDLPHARGLEALPVARALAAGGARVIQVRAKGGFVDAWADARGEAWSSLMQLAAQAGFMLVINDDVGLAMRLGEASANPIEGMARPRLGVHLGQEDLRAAPTDLRARLDRQGLSLGVSTHDLTQVKAAAQWRPDYLGFGPVFDTRSKANPERGVGLDALALACTATKLPVVAIGGITVARAHDCVQAGAAALACIGALVGDKPEEIENAASCFCRALAAPKRR